MSDWKVTDKDNNDIAQIMVGLCTGGLSLLCGGVSPTYEIQNEDTGEVRRVDARDEEELGEKIANGDFDDD